jgi:hypothetical protein
MSTAYLIFGGNWEIMSTNSFLFTALPRMSCISFFSFFLVRYLGDSLNSLVAVDSAASQSLHVLLVQGLFQLFLFMADK